MLVSPGSPARYRRNIPRVTEVSARNARTWARRLAENVGCDPEILALVFSELITNVLRYAAGPAQLVAARTDKGIEISCADRHPETANDVKPGDLYGDTDAVSGRGLSILDALGSSGIHVWSAADRKRIGITLPIGEAQ
jgi:anti-sigma regulatory factor (Ser/Thr protein kinase)